MNILRRIYGRTMNPLEARLERLVGRRNVTPVWLTNFAKPIHHSGIELYRDAQGTIRHLRIGAWRVIAASNSRRIAEIRDLACNRIAVRIERHDVANRLPRSTTWELYDLDGHLLAMLQSIPGQTVWLATDFESGTVTKLNPISRL